MAEPFNNLTAAQNPNPSGGLQPTSYDLTNTQFLFNRSWLLAVDTNPVLGPPAPSAGYAGLRMVFEVEKNSTSTANKAKIEVYNFSTQSRQHYIKGTNINLMAGYAGGSPSSQGTLATIFAGTTSGAVSRVETERKGADIVTTFECGDGEKELVTTVFNQSYPPKTPVARVVDDLISALTTGTTLSKGVNTGVTAVYNTGAVYSNGFVASGGARQLLDRILAKLNFQWSVQNGCVVVYPIGKSITKDAVVVDQNSGLIGVPSYGTGGDNVVKFSALLNPKLVPGGLVSLQSENFQGTFVIRNSKFEGDTHGNKWQTTCECLPADSSFNLVTP